MADPFRPRRGAKTPPAGGGRFGIDRGGMGSLWSVEPIPPPSEICINNNRYRKGLKEAGLWKEETGMAVREYRDPGLTVRGCSKQDAACRHTLQS